MPRGRDELGPNDWPHNLSDEEFDAAVQVILDEPTADLIGGWRAGLELARQLVRLGLPGIAATETQISTASREKNHVSKNT